MTHAFSVNAVYISRNDECIYSYRASGYRGHAFKRPFPDTPGHCKRPQRLSHASQKVETNDAVCIRTNGERGCAAGARYTASATGVAAPSLRAAGGASQARETACQRPGADRCRPPRDETPGCTPHQDHADRMGPPISPPLLPEISVYIHQHIRPCATQAT